MARTLAIEWDSHEIRCVVGRGRGNGSLTVDRAAAIPLPALAEGEKRSAKQLGTAIRDGLAQARIRATSALVGISRTAVELRQLTLPPAPDEELPELVRHQASREFTAITDGTVLDFVALGVAGQSQRVVAAAALAEEQLDFVRDACNEAGIKPQRLLLRPYAASSLLASRHREGIVLLVDSQSDETDLIVLVAGEVFLCRTVRAQHRSGGDDESAESLPDSAALVAEIRRTTIAVQNQSGGGNVAAICIAGCSAEERELARQLNEELAIPVELFDPWSDVQADRALESEPLEHPGRFTALLGMLADETLGRPSGFDFLNPKRRPKPVNRRRLAVVGVAAAVAIAAAGAYFAWGQFSEVRGRISRMEQRSRELDQLVKRGAEKQAAVAAIEEWALSDVVWLDELRDLSLRFPQPRDAVMTRLTLSARPTGGGNIDLEGLVRDPSIVARMESQLRDEYHEIRTRRVQESVQGKTNTWNFDSLLLVSRRSKDDYLAFLPVGSEEELPNSSPTAPSAMSPPKGEAAVPSSEQTRAGTNAESAQRRVP